MVCVRKMVASSFKSKPASLRLMVRTSSSGCASNESMIKTYVGSSIKMFATKLIDVVIIGNGYASDEELVVMAQVNPIQVEFSFTYVGEPTALVKKS